LVIATDDARWKAAMDYLSAVNTLGAVTTIVAALLVASNYSPKIMVAGFSVFVLASVAWIIAGYLDNKSSLVLQNAVLLLINLAGIWRWLPKAT
jgi:hypothetical protein